MRTAAVAESPAYKPSSLRTNFAPATMFFSFTFAAQRAVWLSPQSGGKESRSAGAVVA